MRGKILAVDDSKMMLRIISGTIDMLDFETLKAANGREAMEILEAQGDEVTLVLLDWNMPEMNGLETLEAIKSDDRFSSIPVMMVTTEGEKKNVIKAIKAGAKHYLTKPFNQQDLATRIMECLGLGL
ncbi:MAG: response regulator [Deltaproteobacteria bacterium]|nr:response regulator [Deltaproteobacteria bacterium]